MSSRQTVVVIFDVDIPDREAAENIVSQRLDNLLVLWQNDSNDITNGTCDPINTYVVLPCEAILQDSL